MKNNPYQMNTIHISSKQFFVITILFIVGDAILYVPALIIKEAGHSMWIVGLLSLGEGILLAFMYAKLGNHLKTNSFLKFLEKVSGKWLGKILGGSFLFYIFVDLLLMIYEMGSFMVTIIITETPIEYVIIAFLLVVIIGGRLGLETIVRSAQVLFPWFIGLYLLLIFSNLSNATFENLQPLFERGAYLIIKGNFSIISYTLETVILLFLFPYIAQKEKANQAYIKGITAGLFLLIIISIFALAVSGFAVLKMQLYPSYMLGQTLQLSFFNHIEVVMAIIWFISLFFKVVICFFVLTQGLSELLKIQEYKVLTFPLGMLIFVCSILFVSNNTYLGNFISSTWISYSITYGFLFPLCLLILSWGRSKLRN